jgi:hypothetical protein
MSVLISNIDRIVTPIDSHEPDEADTTSDLQAQKDDLEWAIPDVEELIRELQEFVDDAWIRISKIGDVLNEREDEEAVAAE